MFDIGSYGCHLRFQMGLGTLLHASHGTPKKERTAEDDQHCQERLQPNPITHPPEDVPRSPSPESMMVSML